MAASISRNSTAFNRLSLIRQAEIRVKNAEDRATTLADALKFGRNAAASAPASLRESSSNLVMMRALVQSAVKHRVGADAPLRMNSSGAIKSMGTFKTMFTWAQNKQDKMLAETFGESRVTLQDLRAFRDGAYKTFLGEVDKLESDKPVKGSVHHAAALQAELNSVTGQRQIERETRLSDAEVASARWELGELMGTNPVACGDRRSALEKLVGANGPKRERIGDAPIF